MTKPGLAKCQMYCTGEQYQDSKGVVMLDVLTM